jgi:RimJ/RimL family protein N-acetyltransferase
MPVEPIILEGEFVRLEPLKLDYLESLAAIGLEESIWRWVPTQPKTVDDLRQYVETALDERRRGVSLPFVTISKADEKIVGSTRFGNIDMINRKVEIGWTWINPKWQRTVINTEAKLLMFTHAFETWNCVRVELKTDALNEKSRNAILRIGAKQEGILRRHMITDTGRFRDTVYFSVLDDEWPVVKQSLLDKLKC